jgi:F-type H+-transporting ATPase subunit delta
MKTTKQARREAKQLYRACLKDGLLDEARAREIVTKVVETKPRGYLGILGHFQRLVKLDADRRTALVESAAPLSPDFQEKLKADLSQKYGRGLNISFAQNADLIGGMKIRVGSDVYDGTVQARLASLLESF